MDPIGPSSFNSALVPLGRQVSKRTFSRNLSSKLHRDAGKTEDLSPSPSTESPKKKAVRQKPNTKARSLEIDLEEQRLSDMLNSPETRRRVLKSCHSLCLMCVCVCVCVCMYVCMYACMHACIRMYADTYRLIPGHRNWHIKTAA